jgi:hypothetical protein
MRLWIDLMETTDELLRAGLRASLGPGEDFQEAYRRWHEERAREHDAMIWNMARRFAAAEDRHAPSTDS